MATAQTTVIRKDTVPQKTPIKACIVPPLANVAKEDTTYKARPVKMYSNGKTVIGEIIADRNLESKIYLIKSTQTKDSTGQYITSLQLGNNGKTPLLGLLDVRMIFNHPVTSIDCNWDAEYLMTSISNDKMTYLFTANPYSQDHGSLIFTIISRDKILVRLYGTSGD